MSSLEQEQCGVSPGGRRRHFWTTQPSPCGTYDECGAECGVPGLQKRIGGEDCVTCSCCGSNPHMLSCPKSFCDPLTFATNDWVRSLAINMLMTDARRDDNECCRKPGTLNGHWSESFMREGQKIGTSLRYIDAQFMRVPDIKKEIQTRITTTMQKLIIYKVASKFTVVVDYLGSNKFAANIEIFGQQGVIAKVACLGGRLANAWVWETQ